MSAGKRQPASLLPTALRGGPAPWVVAVMTALALLASALALTLAPAASALRGQIAGRATVQVVAGDAIERRDAVRQLRQMLTDAPYVATVHLVPEAELRAMAARWLGEGVGEAELPLPALIDVDLVGRGSDAALARLRRDVARTAPDAQVIAHADWLAPVADLFRSLAWTAAALAAAALAATGAVAVLTVRAALAAERATIDILHLVGATDRQVARLFQGSMARDMLGGVAMGTLIAALLGGLIAWQMRGVTFGIAPAGASLWSLALLLLVPPAFVAIAVATTRITVLRHLRRMP